MAGRGKSGKILARSTNFAGNKGRSQVQLGNEERAKGLLTTEATGDLCKVHHRRPLALGVEESREWMAKMPQSEGSLVAKLGTNHAIIEAYRHAIATNFFTGAALALLAFATVLALPEVPLRARARGENDSEGKERFD